MFTFLRPQFLTKTFVLVICLLFSGCATFSKPDSCDHENGCELRIGNDQLVELAVGESKNVHVCGCKPWNETGIAVNEGQVYRFEINEVSNWVDGTVQSDPVDGWQGGFYKVMGFLSGFLKRSDEAKWYAVVGVVGQDDEQSFAVTNNHAWQVPINTKGALYFYANDMEGRYFNNHGTLQLKVTHAK